MNVDGRTGMPVRLSIASTWGTTPPSAPRRSRAMRCSRADEAFGVSMVMRRQLLTLKGLAEASACGGVALSAEG